MGWITSLFGNADSASEALNPPHADLHHEAAPPIHAEAAVARTLPRFRGTAADHLRSGARLHDRLRLQLRRAFTPARPIIDPALFAGRTELLQTMIRAIEDQYLHVVLFGPRGIGKTSMLHVLCGIARESRYIVRYLSCGERTGFDGLIRAVLADIPLLFHADYDPTGTAIEEGLSFAALLDDAPVTVDSSSDLLGKVAGTRLLIVLDEFDRAADADFRRAIAELIKNLSDRGSRVQLVIAGVAQNLTEIIEHVPSIRRNVLGLLVPNMTRDEIAELISNGQTASGMSFSPKALQLISLTALGLPYLASLVSQHAGLAALDRGATTVGAGDVEIGIGQVLDHLDLRIPPAVRHRMEQALSTGHDGVLERLAQIALANSFRLPLGEIERELACPIADHPGLRDLEIGYRMIMPIHADPTGAYAFVDDGVPLFLWIRLMHGHVLEAPVP